MKKPCARCGTEFRTFASREATNPRIYCSKSCSALSRTSRNPRVAFKCEGCGKDVMLYPSQIALDRRFCSRECSADTRRIGYIKEGYRCFTIDCKQVYEHRLVMEEMIGRPLFVHETVHHKNGNRLDNAPDNLELWSSVQPRGQRVEDKIAWAKKLLTDYGFNHDVMSVGEVIAGISALV